MPDAERANVTAGRSTGLVDILDRVLDKGLVIAGDIKISLANVELLTIQIRLLVCSIDKAEQIGLNWWRYDTALSRQGALDRAQEQEEMRARVGALEQEIRKLSAALGGGGPVRPARTRRRTRGE
ncbi:MAG: gas vesicle protein [Chloroflexi bacterium]|nr:gas vesicle protein [Chloroflexota bacterium]